VPEQQWEDVFGRWMQGPSETESQKAENAARMIRAAIQEHQALKNRDITVFAQGSYRNRTNVRQESDVDICVLCKDTFYYDTNLAPDLPKASLNISPATYDFTEYKQDVYDALISKFGSAGVSRGSKAFDVHENTYRIAADVVPCFEYRLYTGIHNSQPTYISGTALKADSPNRIIQNYPEHHYENGVRKHTETARQFKKKARILKRLRHHLISQNIPLGDSTSSFLLECLVYNCAVQSFTGVGVHARVKQVLADIWGQLEAESTKRTMLEVNEVKYLFHPNQPWSLDDAKRCILAMWTEIT